MARNDPNPIPREETEIPLETAMIRVRESGVKGAMLRAVQLVGEGRSAREAAALVGLPKNAIWDIWRVAKKHGVVGAKTAELITIYRGVAHLAAEELERRLLDDELCEKVLAKELSMIARDAGEKVAEYEQWRERGLHTAPGYLSALDKIAAAVAAGGRLTLEVQPRPDYASVDSGAPGTALASRVAIPATASLPSTETIEIEGARELPELRKEREPYTARRRRA
jgi:hypothetical protein